MSYKFTTTITYQDEPHRTKKTCTDMEEVVSALNSVFVAFPIATSRQDEIRSNLRAFDEMDLWPHADWDVEINISKKDRTPVARLEIIVSQIEE